MKTAVVTCMRNEAIFLLEWLAYQLVCGFDRVAVITNDCTEGTDTLLDKIAEVDSRIIHIENQIGPGEAPQVAGLRNARLNPELMEMDYWLHCDADEFLHVSLGEGKVGDLLAVTGNADCVAVAWRAFGDSGISQWKGGLVLEQCTMADDQIRGSMIMHKCLFRPSRFGAAIDHMPKAPVDKTVTVVNTRGERLPPRSMFHPRIARFKGTPWDRLTWDGACLHHYAIKARNVFLMKNLRGNGMGHQSERYLANSKFWRKFNKNIVEVPAARQHLDAVGAQIEAFYAIPDVVGIEAKALSDFILASAEFEENVPTTS